MGKVLLSAPDVRTGSWRARQTALCPSFSELAPSCSTELDLNTHSMLSR